MTEKIICAGFGGQGVMVLGKLIAYAGMLHDRQVSWLPSYGPEMRGGTANCHVILSDEPIGSPIVSRDADFAIVMNKPSMEKFEISLAPGGRLLINSSLVSDKASRKDLEVYYIPANEIASECGVEKDSNLVMLGAYLALTKSIDEKGILVALSKVFDSEKTKLLSLHKKALEKGTESIKI
ncbi:2-oxoacid:acceptor oxidoreductase family protein [uncultured Ilyobacter sp.]|uniref:2-oxoacid:acceptor oxidoreductase family protein n=1 Tax=uncultured Ilyobacter sp. TaxID=544433 RepID=UPI0029C92BF1|nr:2-oxoacid:acceptor oxidoreductase family protein [uncultured Ilyobacter sp.]